MVIHSVVGDKSGLGRIVLSGYLDGGTWLLSFRASGSCWPVFLRSIPGIISEEKTSASLWEDHGCRNTTLTRDEVSFGQLLCLWAMKQELSLLPSPLFWTTFGVQRWALDWCIVWAGPLKEKARAEPTHSGCLLLLLLFNV